MSRTSGVTVTRATTGDVLRGAFAAVMNEQELQLAALTFAAERLPTPYKALVDHDVQEFIEAMKLIVATSMTSEPSLTNSPEMRTAEETYLGSSGPMDNYGSLE